MNLLILGADELDSDSSCWIEERRHEHLRTILRAVEGDQVRAGIVGKSMGLATILTIEKTRTLLRYTPLPELSPPASHQCRLILALPRPPVLRRVIQSATTLGFKEIHLLHAARVEKSYWQSPELQEDKLQYHMTLGLEQAVDIRMPILHSHQRFRPFVEDVLPGLQRDRPSYVADPSADRPCPALEQDTVCNLLIGPEGGWVPFELETLGQTGVNFVRLGKRILRVETALPYMVGCLQIGNS